jgi:hypothetical protein
VSENKDQKRIFGIKRDEIIRDGKELNNESFITITLTVSCIM